MDPSLTIDCHYYGKPLVAAAYLLRDGDQAAFIDNNTTLALPRLLEALRSTGLAPEAVRWLIVTHVHLDHAGGTSALARACPEATVLAHPRAAPHLVDPSRLVSSARKVYGDAMFDQLYGAIEPIEAGRVKDLQDGATVALGSRTLRFLHTRGHANHHFCILDEADATIYTGDAFGLAYPFLQRAGVFVFPSTSPTDFDAAEARLSLDRILSAGARRAMPTHFGEVTAISEAVTQVKGHLGDAEAVLEAAIRSDLPDSELEGYCARQLGEAFEAALGRRGLVPTDEERQFLGLDLQLNAAGVAHVARKKRGQKG